MLRALLGIGSIQLLMMVVLLARTKGLALLLGPDQVGLMAVIDRLIAVFTQTASLSLPFAAARFLPAVSGDDGAFRRRLRDMSNLLLWTSFLATGVGLVLLGLRPALLGSELGAYPRVLLAAFLSLPIASFVPLVQRAIAGRFEHGRSMVFALAHAVVFTSSALIGVWIGGLAWLYAMYAAMGVVLILIAYRHLGLAPARWSLGEGWRGLFSMRLPPEMWRFSAALLVLTFLAPYAALYVNRKVLSEFGPTSVGWMGAAVGVSLSVRTLFGAAHPVLLTPNVNRDSSLAARMEWANEYQKTFSLLIGATLPPLLLFPHLAVQILYSSSFIEGAAAVALFVLVEVITLYGGTYGALVVACDEMAFHVAQNVVAQFILIGAGALLIPRLGIRGAGVAGILAFGFLLVAPALFLRRKYGLRIPARVIAIGVYVLIALAIAGWIGVHFPDLTVRVVLGKLAAYAVLVAGLPLLMSREEIERVKALARGFAARRARG